MVFSNYECLYLDCGYGAWVGEGNNWCSPYKGMHYLLGTRNICPLSLKRGMSSLSLSLRTIKQCTVLKQNLIALKTIFPSLYLHPYIRTGWQKMYDNDLYKLLEDRGFDATDPAIKNLVLGAESAMWSEQVRQCLNWSLFEWRCFDAIWCHLFRSTRRQSRERFSPGRQHWGRGCGAIRIRDGK